MSPSDHAQTGQSILAWNPHVLQFDELNFELFDYGSLLAQVRERKRDIIMSDLGHPNLARFGAHGEMNVSE